MIPTSPTSSQRTFLARLGRLDLSTPFDGRDWFARLAAAALGMAVLTAGMLALDDRTLGGEPVWLKPLKFALSFLVLFATLAAVAGRLSRRWRTGWPVLAAAGASGAAFAFEMAYIGIQAARAEPSHFNESTPFHALMYSLMGTGASALMASIAALGVIAWLDPGARLGRGARLGTVLGFLLTVALTMLVAGELAGNGGRYVGTPSAEGPRLPFLGWSMEVGDLRPAHFLSLHLMQAIPIVGVLADRLRLGPRVVWAVAAGLSALTLLVFAQAMRGLPLVAG